jgi:hypothetical protein
VGLLVCLYVAACITSAQYRIYLHSCWQMLLLLPLLLLPLLLLCLAHAGC